MTLGTYLSQGLSFDPGQIGRAFSTMSGGGRFPFIVGMIADRFFAVITYGVGMVIGADLTGEVVQHFTTSGPADAVVEQVIHGRRFD